MTFSILACDPENGTIGGAAATGSLCVGGWVLRGSLRAGMSASQGAAPSTFWGEDVLSVMAHGTDASKAVAHVVEPDAGRDYRQLAAMDLSGSTAAFTGKENTPEMGSRKFSNGIASGNMLARVEVLDAMAEVMTGSGPLDARLLDAISAAQAAGSDSRGLLSAALLILHPDSAPLTLRVDHHTDDPIGALRDLHHRATSGEYNAWARQVPTMNDRSRVLD
ncbi:DUF1028 domain-containing protein [Pseudoruegeria sp. HB172150]|uniref:DUF1028 domain-containing protein n=1 Tax=Pseudoruegeria sp. HB172150 TaxID=2721164 RepID=UPI001552C812|nr:DUF1028 domain-containing protein [Pseudoruegeria sp. HB172150]